LNLRYAEEYTEREAKGSERTWGDFETEDEGKNPDQTTEKARLSQELEYNPRLATQFNLKLESVTNNS
jgi:hypothetical protein